MHPYLYLHLFKLEQKDEQDEALQAVDDVDKHLTDYIANIVHMAIQSYDMIKDEFHPEWDQYRDLQYLHQPRQTNNVWAFEKGLVFPVYEVVVRDVEEGQG